MQNPFTALKDYVQKPNRNTFDLSFANSGTYKFGKLYPVFCKEVVPGDSFKIDTTFGLRFMPLVFPIQTRMNANIHYFYVRNRNLWKDWPDFIGRTKQGLVPPYLSQDVIKRLATTGGLGDYLGLPTTISGDYGRDFVYNSSSILMPKTSGGFANYFMNNDGSSMEALLDYSYNDFLNAPDDNLDGYYGCITPAFAKSAFIPAKRKYGDVEYNSYFLDFTYHMPYADYLNYRDNNIAIHFNPFFFVGDVVTYIGPEVSVGSFSSSGFRVFPSMIDDESSMSRFGTYVHDIEINDYSVNFKVTCRLYDISVPSSVSGIMVYWNNPNDGASSLLDVLNDSTGSLRIGILDSTDIYTFSKGTVRFGYPNYRGISLISLSGEFDLTRDVSELPDEYNVYTSQHISALPFRAYESIYNAFYRNQFNDPFTINGIKEFNKFIPNSDGGEDTTLYELHSRNWETDFLTSAKQSPIDGDITPLVGVSGTGKFTFQNTDGSTYTVTPILGDDGKTLTGIDSIEGTPDNNSGVRRLMDMASVGISINDFRNVNALQRWLETNLRRGYRYKDQLLSHFGVDAKFDVLDMPEFIGGVSQPVNVNQVNQTVDATNSASGLGDFSKVLGSFAGQASVVGQSRHSVSKYCDEHGFIIGILSITPVPVYTQLLPKFFVKDNVLDYYFPEFGHIGNQPISYKEVCPIQSFAAGDAITDVFGYQRAWYDYLSSVDEAHGDFRLSLDGFLINRVFDVRPELGKDFVEVDADDISDPFSVTDDVDKILGQIYFDVTAQRPIPKFGIPRLE